MHKYRTRNHRRIKESRKRTRSVKTCEAHCAAAHGAGSAGYYECIGNCVPITRGKCPPGYRLEDTSKGMVCIPEKKCPPGYRLEDTPNGWVCIPEKKKAHMRARTRNHAKRLRSMRKKAPQPPQLTRARRIPNLPALAAAKAMNLADCDVGPADSWYWKIVGGTLWVCCSSGGDEACTQIR